MALETALGALAGDGWSKPVDAILPPVLTAERIATALATDPSVNEAIAIPTPETGSFFACLTLNEENRSSLADLMLSVKRTVGGPLPPIRLKSRPVLARDAKGGIDLAAVLKLAAQDDPPEGAAPPQTALENGIPESGNHS